MNVGTNYSFDLNPISAAAPASSSKVSSSKASSKDGGFVGILSTAGANGASKGQSAPDAQPVSSDTQTNDENNQSGSQTSSETKNQSQGGDPISKAMSANLAAIKHAAMRNFLNHMQKEFGIKPEKIVQAFSKLSIKDLAKPPEDSADKLISELKLNHKDAQKATDLYSKMLGVVAAANMAQQINKRNEQAFEHPFDPKFQAMPNGINGAFVQEQFTVQKLPNTKAAQTNTQLNALNQSDQSNAKSPKIEVARAASGLSGVTSSVASSGAAIGSATTVATGAAAATPTNMSAADMANSQALKKPDHPVNMKAAQTVQNGLQPNAQDAAHAQSQTNLQSQINSQTPMRAQTNIPSMHAQALAPTASVPASPIPTAAANEAQNSALAAAHSGTINSAAAVAQTKSMQAYSANQQNGQAGNHDRQNDAQSGQDVNYQNIQANLNSNQSHIMGAKSTLTAAQATPADMKNNVQDIISRAQFLANRGGGEMKVSLSPKGLGDLNLKVKLNKGQLHVEMLASNDEAKNLIQKNLGELKQSLATHKIHLDTIKIDTPKDIANQFNHQRQEMEQHFQRSFLNNFNDRNNSERNNYFEFGAPALAANQSRDQVSNSTYSAATRRKDSSRRLDLVA